MKKFIIEGKYTITLKMEINARSEDEAIDAATNNLDAIVHSKDKTTLFINESALTPDTDSFIIVPDGDYPDELEVVSESCDEEDDDDFYLPKGW